MLFRLLILAPLLAASCSAQIPFEAREIDDLGGLGPDLDGRGVAELGAARAEVGADGRLRIEGVDDAGLPWRVWFGRAQGFPRVRVFSGDFDANGRGDLLFAANVVGNGRCIDGGEVTTLLIDERGRPVPWRAWTSGMLFDRDRPVVLLDQDGDGRAELLTHLCGLPNNLSEGGEERYLTGLFEAGEARWERRELDSPEFYRELVLRRLGEYAEGFVEWIATPPDAQIGDMHAGWDDAQPVRVVGLVESQFGCEAWAKASEGGRPTDHCAYVERASLRYSDGTETQSGPDVVLDLAAGREVWIEPRSEGLDRVLASGVAVRRLGGEGSLTTALWAEADVLPAQRTDEAAAEIIGRKTTSIELISRAEWEERKAAREASRYSGPVVVSLRGLVSDSNAVVGRGLPGTGQLPFATLVPAVRNAAAFDLTFSRDGRCFGAESLEAATPTVVALDDCNEMGELANEASAGARVVIQAGRVAHLLDAETPPRIATGFGEPRTRTLEWSGMKSARLISFASDWKHTISQWESGGRSWIVAHHRNSAVGGAGELEGELIGVGRSGELTLLRWEDGAPVERIDVALRLVRVRD